MAWSGNRFIVIEPGLITPVVAGEVAGARQQRLRASMREFDVKIFGINMGHLGFLSEHREQRCIGWLGDTESYS